jgi:hypothetical protein
LQLCSFCPCTSTQQWSLEVRGETLIAGSYSLIAVSTRSSFAVSLVVKVTGLWKPSCFDMWTTGIACWSHLLLCTWHSDIFYTS